MARVLVALVIAESISSFEGSMIYTAVSVLYRTFEDPVLVGWIISAFVLVNAGSAAIGARLGDLFGRRRVLIVCIALASVGSLISAVSTEAWGVIVGRGIQGLAGPILPLCFGLVREHLPLERVPLGIGVIAATAIFTSGIASLIGGIVVDHYSWQGIFYFSSALAVLIIPIVMLMLPPSLPAGLRHKLDWVGGVAFVVPITALLFAVGKFKDWGWHDPRLLTLVLMSLIALAVWVWYELRRHNPMIDVRLLLRRKVLIANLGLVLVGMGPMQAMMVVSLQIQQPSWTEAGLGLSATALGMLMFASNTMGMLGAPLCGAIATRFGPRLPLLGGTLLLAVSFIAMMFWRNSFTEIFMLMLLIGFGQSVVFAAAPILVTGSVPFDRVSEANGLSGVLRQTGMAVSTQVISLLFATHTVVRPELGPDLHVSETGFLVVFGYIATASLLSVIVALCLGRTKTN